jgi:peptide/nickel transport system permease protein
MSPDSQPDQNRAEKEVELEPTSGTAGAMGTVEQGSRADQVKPESVLNPKKVEAGRGFWAETWYRYRKQPTAMAAFAVVCALGLVAIFSPAIAGTKPVIVKYKGNIYFPCMGYFFESWENPIFRTDKFRSVYPRSLMEKDPDYWAIWPIYYNDPFRPVRADEWPGRAGNPYGVEGYPTWKNPFGTHRKGYDVFAQMVHGTRIALLVGFVSTGLAAIIGITLGALAGYFGGSVDIFLSRLIEVVMCIPPLALILAIIAVLQHPTIWHLMAVLGITSWTGMARLTRAEFMKLKNVEFVAAAKSLGIPTWRIMARHILPNALAPVMVPIAFGIAAAILVEAGLSLLGFGAPPPNPSWGSVLMSGRENYSYWWTILFPGLAIFTAVLAYNLIGEGIQEAIDPRLRESTK